MQKLINLPIYGSVAEIIESVHTLASPAEVHGLLCGIICSGKQQIDSETWAAKAMGLGDKDLHLSKKQATILQQLLDYSYNRLTQMEFDFQLLLPDEEASLSARSAEIGSWCHGFLIGLELTSDLDVTSDRLSVEGYDTLVKLSEIAEIDYEDLDYSERDETALVEVVEFVRLAILTIYSELNQGTSGISIPTSRMVH